MPNFQTPYETRKWNQLERLANEAFSTLKSGKAKKEDLDRARQVIAEFGSSLVEVLNDSVSSMQTMADERIAKIEAHRESLGKSELDEQVRSKLLELALTRTIESESVELAVTLESLVRDTIREQNSYLSELLDEKLAAYMTDEPESDEELKKLNSFEAYVKQKLDQVDSNVRATETQLKDTIVNSFASYRHDMGEELEASNEAPTVIDRIVPEESEEDREEIQDTSAIHSDLGVLNSRLDNILERLDPKRLQNEKEDEEEERADIWFKKMYRNARGVVARTARRVGGLGIVGGLMAVLGRMLITNLTGTEVWKPLYDKLDEYTSARFLKNLSTEFFDYITSKARDLITWITSRLPGFDTSVDTSMSPETPFAAMAGKDPGVPPISADTSKSPETPFAAMAGKSPPPSPPKDESAEKTHISPTGERVQNSVSKKEPEQMDFLEIREEAKKARAEGRTEDAERYEEQAKKKEVRASSGTITSTDNSSVDTSINPSFNSQSVTNNGFSVPGTSAGEGITTVNNSFDVSPGIETENPSPKSNEESEGGGGSNAGPGVVGLADIPMSMYSDPASSLLNVAALVN